MVGERPANPTMAVSTMLIGSASTIWSRASAPAYTLMSGWSASRFFSSSYLASLAMTTAAGLNFRACWASSSTLLLAVRQYTSYRSACSSMTWRACVPIDPVLPRMAICFFISFLLFYLWFILQSSKMPSGNLMVMLLSVLSTWVISSSLAGMSVPSSSSKRMLIVASSTETMRPTVLLDCASTSL